MSAQSLVGTVLGQRWEVRELIGEGELARVYAGWDQRLSRSVTLKVLREDQDANAFQQRAGCAARLQHAHIATVLDVGDNFVVGEYYRAQDVGTLLRQSGRLSVERSLEIAMAALEAIDAAHGGGILHGALRPANILLTARGEVKITDFGIAADPLDPRSDLHAMGAVLYQMLCGRAPTEPPTRLSSVGVSVPPALEAAIVKAMQPTDSFESAAAFLQSLRAIQGHGAANGNGAATLPSEPRRIQSALEETVVRSNGHKVTLPPAPLPPPSMAERRSNFPTFAIILVLALASATGLFFLAIDTYNRVQVPNVLGSSEDVARHQLEKIGLRLVVREIQYNEQMQPGTIMSQEPDARSQVHPGDAVTVVLSKGKQTIAIPNLSGMDRQDARQALEERGLEPKWTEEFSETVPVGMVTSQEPHSGVIVDLRAQVKVAISKGPPQVTVPDLLGHTEKECGDLIEKAGLKVTSTTTKPSATIPRGQVLEQKPAAKTRVDKGSQVEIVLSSGPDARSVPNLRGLSLRDARKKAISQGFSVAADGPLADNEEASVKDQYPEGGAVVQQGGSIHLSLQPAPTPTEPAGTIGVPDVVQLQLDVARITLEEQGLKLGNITPQESDQPQNTVLRQTPAAGSHLKRGATVDVVIAFPKTDKNF